jgi:hypothetical protein
MLPALRNIVPFINAWFHTWSSPPAAPSTAIAGRPLAAPQ